MTLRQKAEDLCKQIFAVPVFFHEEDGILSIDHIAIKQSGDKWCVGISTYPLMTPTVYFGWSDYNSEDNALNEAIRLVAYARIDLLMMNKRQSNQDYPDSEKKPGCVKRDTLIE